MTEDEGHIFVEYTIAAMVHMIYVTGPAKIYHVSANYIELYFH